MERAAPTVPDDDRTEAAPGEALACAPVTVFVCVTCGARPDGASAGEALHAALAGAAAREEALSVAPIKCLSNCKRALSAAVTRADGWSYVFGDLADDAAHDLLEGARLLSASADGLMPWRGRPERLKRGMVSRLPPLSGFKDPS